MDIKKIISRKRVYIPFLIIVLYTVTGFWILPGVVKNKLTATLETVLKRPVSIERIAINPYALSIRVDSFSVTQPSGEPFFAFDGFFADMSVSSLFMMAPVLSAVTLEHPAVRLVRNKDGSFNFSDLMPPNAEPGRKDRKVPSESSHEIFPFIIENLQIVNGDLHIDDQTVDIAHTIDPLNLSIPRISSRLKDARALVTADLNGIVNRTRLDVRIQSTPFAGSAATTVEINTSDADLMHYLSYLPLPEGVAVKDLDLNLYAKMDYARKNSGHDLSVRGRVSLLNADIKGRQDTELLAFKQLEIILSPSPILHRQINLDKIRLLNPVIHVSRDTEGQLNLMTYLPGADRGQEALQTDKEQNHKTEPAPDAVEESLPFTVTLSSGSIQEADLIYDDNANTRPFSTRVFPLNLDVTQFSAGEQIQGKYILDCRTESDETLASKGEFLIDPLQIQGDLRLNGVPVDKYAPFYESFIGFDIKSGRSNLATGFTLSRTEPKADVNLLIDIEQVSVTGLNLEDRSTQEQILFLPEFKISDAAVDLLHKKIDTGKIETQGGAVLLKRLKNGQINFMPHEPEAAGNAETGPKKMPETEPDDHGKPVWGIVLNRLDLKDYTLNFKDETTQEPVNVALSNIGVTAAGLSTTNKDPGTVDIKMNVDGQGRISVKGTAVASAPSADLKIELDRIGIKSFQPYFTQAVKIMVASGDFNAAGKLVFGKTGTDPIQLRFAGQTSVTDFVSLDKKNAKDFFKCNSLYLADADVSLFPLSVVIRDISLTDFYTRIRVSESGSLNLTDVFQSGEKPVLKDQENKDADSAGISRIQVDNVTLQGGNIMFSDHLTQPNFQADMKDITGSVIGLSSRQDTRAKLHLKGFHGTSSPLDIVGVINPLAPEKYVDIDISFKDIELTKFTPYSSKYLGYKIEKGKLILELDYQIDGNKLVSANRARFDNFHLGEAVKSEHATSLPIGLAISLLKDRQGRINLDLPVTGELDDPEFRVGSIVMKMIANLILKVVTSPFAVIGSMFGGGEDLGFAEYDFGKWELSSDTTVKLDTLSQILVEKPSVMLEIQGMYHPLKDRQALQVLAYEDLIRAQKVTQMVAQGQSTDNLENIVVTDEQRTVFIETAYQEAQFPKPRDETGEEKPIDIEKKEQLLITSMEVTEENLRSLAMKRSEVIKDHLIVNGGVPKERIFLIEPKSSNEEFGNEKTRVLFLLK